MRFSFLRPALAVAALALLASAPASAQLLGAPVTGTLQFGGIGPNYFDPINGLVPAGVLDTAGPTVVIAEPAVEFGFDDFTERHTVNFTGTQLILTNSARVADSAAYTMTFTSPAFAGVTEVSDTFLNGGATASLSGGTITVSVPEFLAVGAFQAVYNVTVTPTAAIPEPGTLALLAPGLLPLLGMAARRRRG